MNLGVVSLIKEAIGAGKELIEDKDKRNQFADNNSERAYKLAETIIKRETTPKVDAIVKLAYAARDCILPMFRPVGGFILSAAGVYLAINHPDTHELIMGALIGSGPAWGYSRYKEKVKGVNQPSTEAFDDEE